MWLAFQRRPDPGYAGVRQVSAATTPPPSRRRRWKFTKRHYLLLATLLVIALVAPSAGAGVKAILLVSDMFPEMPFRPLQYLTATPSHQQVEFWYDDSPNGPGPAKVVADYFVPHPTGTFPAIMVTMGVLDDKTEGDLLSRLSSLSRLGYVVMWPRREALVAHEVLLEDPSTFVRSFRFLLDRPEVDKRRISFLGLSAGASLALIAAQHPDIRDSVRCFVFFGGYYHMEAYLKEIARGEYVDEGKVIPWERDPWLIWFADEMLKPLGLSLADFIDWPDGRHVAQLDRLSPDRHIDGVQTRLFLLHGEKDPLVPHVQSVALYQDVKGKTQTTMHISTIFAHVQMDGSPTLRSIPELGALHLFILRVLMYL